MREKSRESMMAKSVMEQAMLKQRSFARVRVGRAVVAALAAVWCCVPISPAVAQPVAAPDIAPAQDVVAAEAAVARDAQINAQLAAMTPLERGDAFYAAAVAGTLPLARFPQAIAAQMLSGLRAKGTVLLQVQSAYVQKLLDSGEPGKALAESKRLPGLCPPDSLSLTTMVRLIASCIRASELRQGKAAPEATASVNAYLEGVLAGDVSKTAYAAMPYPPAPPEIEQREKSAAALIATIALLYDGKFEAATQKARQMMAAADVNTVSFGAQLLGRALNGQSGSLQAIRKLWTAEVAADLQQPAFLSLELSLRQMLAENYAALGDEQAGVLYEELVEKSKQLDPVWQGAGILTSAAVYYQKTGQIQKAAALTERVADVTPDVATSSNSRIEAARLYRQLGQEEKAAELYRQASEQAQKGGFGWAAGLVLFDQASTLIAQGEHEEARKLLKTPVTGQFAEQTKVGLLALLGYSYYQTEEFEAARKYSQEAITQYEALKNPLQGEGLETVVEAAKVRLQTMDEWKNKTFGVPLKKLPTMRDGHGVYHAKLYVHSFKKQPVAVRFKDDAVQLVRLTQQSQQRTGSGVIVTVYDLAYRTATHPASLEAQVVLSATPQEQQTIELHPRIEDGE